MENLERFRAPYGHDMLEKAEEHSEPFEWEEDTTNKLLADATERGFDYTHLPRFMAAIQRGMPAITDASQAITCDMAIVLAYNVAFYIHHSENPSSTMVIAHPNEQDALAYLLEQDQPKKTADLQTLTLPLPLHYLGGATALLAHAKLQWDYVGELGKNVAFDRSTETRDSYRARQSKTNKQAAAAPVQLDRYATLVKNARTETTAQWFERLIISDQIEQGLIADDHPILCSPGLMMHMLAINPFIEPTTFERYCLQLKQCHPATWQGIKEGLLFVMRSNQYDQTTKERLLQCSPQLKRVLYHLAAEGSAPGLEPFIDTHIVRYYRMILVAPPRKLIALTKIKGPESAYFNQALTMCARYQDGDGDIPKALLKQKVDRAHAAQVASGLETRSSAVTFSSALRAHRLIQQHSSIVLTPIKTNKQFIACH